MDRILVCGGRKLDPYKVRDALNNFLTDKQVIIIQGEAHGADFGAKMFAQQHGLECLRFPALWEKYGKYAAGPIRNAQMLEEGKPDYVIAFSGGKGTANMIKQALKKKEFL